ncbi:alpha/beta hydrolase family protein [Flavobacterium geliluteum]|uniref:Prolyl oligopeptidase family serine peptidase n=1 Tax=Flavobacterium geliluteum TaxID=2816120 RepID=A0A940XCQ6_9FLAO|nr:prolyl oligopeptidase family serine peptidase [Flavobacterium geliluteum]MBP4137249.1 prolyl oligopeptidase family serine peptidase [Flavobacterium geliluteum]
MIHFGTRKHFSPLSSSLLLNARLHFFLILFLILPLVACSLWGQAVQKKDLTAADYPLWGTLSLEKISPDQNWISYTMTYQNNVDTLFVRNAVSLKTFSFVAIEHSLFTKKNVFVCQNNEGLQITDLNTGKQQYMPSINQFDYSAPADLLLLTINLPRDKKRLILQTPNGKVVKKIADVTDFSLSPNQQHLIYGTIIKGRHTVILLNLKDTAKQKLIPSNVEDVSFGFTWHKDGKTVAFVTRSTEITKTALFYYTLENDKLYHLDLAILSNFSKNTFIPADFTFKISISDDMQKVFFTTKNNNPLTENRNTSNVEIWNSNDKSLFVEREKDGPSSTVPSVGIWLPFSDMATELTTSELPKLMLSGNQQYALLFNPKDYEPQFVIKPGPSDIYIVNLKTFEKQLFLKKHSAHFLELIPSPTGNYISYFKDGHWWVYTIADNTHRNITAGMNVKFTPEDLSYSIAAKNSNAGWSLGDKEMLLYDEFDLWAIKPDGTSFRRLTHGRELKIKYRLANIPGRQPYIFIYDALKLDSFDLEKELILHGQGDDGKTGYFKWNKDSGEKTISFNESYIDQLTYTSEKQNLFYREQKFDLSPQLMVLKKDSNPICIFQSNPQQKKYHWGRSELIDYQNATGIKMKGVLRYPANYDAKKKYPMIVHVYQRQYDQHHKYVNPTLYMEDEDNDTLWSTQGYFVLLPDIIVEYDTLGYSALDCVLAAVKEVLAKEIINPEKIGLMGHSFGGYETSFIITQTNLFAAAIASASSTDLTSFYFTLAKNFSYPNMYRFANGQWKITQTPFEDPEIYWRNSPITYANKVNTPLLLWTGKEDYNIDPHQTMEFYFALRSLRKKCIMLLYPDEGHGISKPINQKDMTHRIQQWFAYYLKDDLSAEWITQGVK